MNPKLHRHFEEQAGFCEALGSPFTARLIEAMARDLEAGGPVARLVGDWDGPPRADAVSLRLAGALHAAALSGRAPALAAVYPGASGEWNRDQVWSRAREFLEDERPWVREFLVSAPQTNESRRSIALLAGFLELAARFSLPMELLEIGASAGLNVPWDRFRYETEAWTWGAADGPRISTDWQGAPPPIQAQPEIRSRAACDLSPLDIRDPEQRLRLRAYVWADQEERLSRFDAVVARAIASGVRVEQADAVAWLESRLAERSPDALTVVYHSVFLQYPPREAREAIARSIELAGERGPGPLAWLRMEPEPVLGGPRDSARFVVDLVTWPGPERRLLAETDGHARFVRPIGASSVG